MKTKIIAAMHLQPLTELNEEAVDLAAQIARNFEELGV